MSALRVSNGQLYLQNISDNLWYTVDVDIFEGQPYLRPGQVAQTVPVGTYSSYAVLQGPDGLSYRFYLDTLEGVVTIGADETNPATPNRIFVRGTDGLYYEIFLSLFEGQIYMSLARSGQVERFINSPYRLIAAITTRDMRTLVEVAAKTQREILVPTRE